MMSAIFIDTSVYRSHQFHFDNARFRSLVTLAEHGHVKLLVTDVTIQEVHANLDELIDDSLTPINKALAGGSVLQRAKAYSLAAVQAPLREDSARKELHASVDSFFEREFTVISTSAIPGGRILDQYFRREPPFGSGKKKSEFPDAFAAAAIVDWATSTRSAVVVVAEDGDWEAVCGTQPLLSHSRSLTSVVEQLLEEEEKAGVLKAHLLVQTGSATIAQAVADELLNEWAYLEDVNGDVLSISPTAARLTSARVVGVEDSVATVEVQVSCDVEFEVAYDDPDSWIYDSEDKVAYYMNRIETTLKRELMLKAEVALGLEDDDVSAPIQHVTLNQERRIGIVVDEYDDYK
jgi:hypothetical protein